MTEAQKAKIARQRAANGRKSAAKQKALAGWFRPYGWSAAKGSGKPLALLLVMSIALALAGWAAYHLGEDQGKKIPYNNGGLVFSGGGHGDYGVDVSGPDLFPIGQ
jgi:hypothetical protein